jgi:hypothetical protein
MTLNLLSSIFVSVVVLVALLLVGAWYFIRQIGKW